MTSNNPCTDAALQNEVRNDPPWLLPAREQFQEKHASSLIQLASVGNVGLDSSFLTLLLAGKLHEEWLHDLQKQNKVTLLNHRDPNLRLQWCGDTRNQHVFHSYQEAEKLVRKFVKYELTSPEFDVTDSAESYAVKCRDDAANQMQARFNEVEPYLSKYAKYHVRKHMAAKKRSVYQQKKMKAADWLQQQQRDAVDLPVDTLGSVASNVQSVMQTPMLRPTNQEGTPIAQSYTPSSMGVNLSLITLSSGKRQRVDPADQAPPISLPLNRSTSWYERLNYEEYENENLQHEHVVPGPNPIPLAVSQQVPTPPSIESAMNKVKIDCPFDLLWLERRTAGGVPENSTEHAIRACETGIRIEKKECRKCIQYRRVVTALRSWVLHPDEPRSVYRFDEIEAVAVERGGGNITSEVLISAAEFLANKTVKTKKMALDIRKSVVLRPLSDDDIAKLEEDMRHERERLVSEERDLAKNEVIRGLFQKKDVIPHEHEDIFSLCLA